MVALVAPLGKLLVEIGASLATSLLTEAFVKKAILIGLEKVAKKTESDIDDRLLQVVKDSWGT